MSGMVTATSLMNAAVHTEVELSEGFSLGFSEGFSLGFSEGFSLGFWDGFPLGFWDGFSLGFSDGFLLQEPLMHSSSKPYKENQMVKIECFQT